MLAQAAASRAPAFLPSGLRRRNAAPRPLRRSTAARSSSDAQPASQPDPQPALRLRGGAAELPPPPENFTVTIHYKETVEVPAGLDWHDEGCDLHSYMMLPVDQYVLLDLPLGARAATPLHHHSACLHSRSASTLPLIVSPGRRHPPGARRRQRHPLHPHHQQDTGAHPPIKTAPSSPSSPTHLLTPSKPPNHIRSYPLAQFFWLEVRPVVQCEVLVLPDTAPCGQGPCVSIRCNSARVEGAWAESNGLNDRFLFSGETRLVWGGKGGAAKGGKGAIVSVNGAGGQAVGRVDGRLSALLRSAWRGCCSAAWKRPCTRWYFLFALASAVS